jgi:hypothetical protein
LRLQDLGQLGNPVTSSGIELATYRLVIKHFSQLYFRLLLTSILLLYSISENAIEFINLPDLSSHITALWVTQPLKEISTRNLPEE